MASIMEIFSDMLSGSPLSEGVTDRVLQFAEEQEQDGASVLDVNMGMSGIDEKAMMLRAVEDVNNRQKLILSAKVCGRFGEDLAVAALSLSVPMMIPNLKQGNIPIYEPGLRELVEKTVGTENLRFTTDINEALAQASICFIAVGTPTGEDGSFIKEIFVASMAFATYFVISALAISIKIKLSLFRT